MKKIILTNEQIEKIYEVTDFDIDNNKTAATNALEVSKANPGEKVRVFSGTKTDPKNGVKSLDPNEASVTNIENLVKDKNTEVNLLEPLSESFTKSQLESLRLKNILENSYVMSKKDFNKLLLSY